jgi:hypothetical protein
LIRRTACFTALIAALGIVGEAQRPGDQVTVPLTDPARPINLNLQLVDGGIRVRGSSRRDVAVIARDRGQDQRNDTAGGTGLRQRPHWPVFSVTEQRNEILFVLRPEFALDFEIEVPNRANLKLGTTAINSAIVVDGVEGELEINNPNGPITLNRVGGSIVANSVDGQVRATITSVSMQKPMALTSFNRDVDVTFPASLKAYLKLRSAEGKVFTDFDVTPLQQTTAADTRREGGRFRVDVNRYIWGAVNGGGPEIELRTFNGNVYVRRGQ